ncbi:macro domain-containing protein [Niallia taxi]|uniref:macro domain-containing protein n=1 Tax=Niallia taxi TaxID=2499688 RepID=UPI003982A5DC
MLNYIHGDIVKQRADIIVNASNGIGWMGGLFGRFIKLNGVAESIHYFDPRIEKEAKRACKKRFMKPGEVFITSSGKLECNQVFHAVTMYLPGTRSSLKSVEKCIQNIIKKAEECGAKSIILPFLGCGTGGLKKEQVNELYRTYFNAYEGITFHIIDKK